jgi:hypothetical protein
MLDKFKRFANIDNASVTPPPPSGECVFITITVTVPQDLTFNITPCGGVATNYTLNSTGTSTYNQCTASVNSLPPGQGTKYTFEVGDVCP